MADKQGKWVTINGRHVFIPKGKKLKDVWDYGGNKSDDNYEEDLGESIYSNKHGSIHYDGDLYRIKNNEGNEIGNGFSNEEDAIEYLENEYEDSDYENDLEEDKEPNPMDEFSGPDQEGPSYAQLEGMDEADKFKLKLKSALSNSEYLQPRLINFNEDSGYIRFTVNGSINPSALKTQLIKELGLKNPQLHYDDGRWQIDTNINKLTKLTGNKNLEKPKKKYEGKEKNMSLEDFEKNYKKSEYDIRDIYNKNELMKVVLDKNGNDVATFFPQRNKIIKF